MRLLTRLYGIVMCVHNNNDNIAHATPTRDVTQPFLAWRIEVRLTFFGFLTVACAARTRSYPHLGWSAISAS